MHLTTWYSFHFTRIHTDVISHVQNFLNVSDLEALSNRRIASSLKALGAPPPWLPLQLFELPKPPDRLSPSQPHISKNISIDLASLDTSFNYLNSKWFKLKSNANCATLKHLLRMKGWKATREPLHVQNHFMCTVSRLQFRSCQCHKMPLMSAVHGFGWHSLKHCISVLCDRQPWLAPWHPEPVWLSRIGLPLSHPQPQWPAISWRRIKMWIKWLSTWTNKNQSIKASQGFRSKADDGEEDTKRHCKAEQAELWQCRAALLCLIGFLNRCLCGLFSCFPEKFCNEGQNQTSQFVTQWNFAMKHFTTWTHIHCEVVHSFRPEFLSCCCIRQGGLLLRVRSLCFFSCFLCIFAMFCSLAMRNVEETKCTKFGLTPRVKTVAGGWMRSPWYE